MTKQQVRELIEKQDIEVLAIRMHYGKPKVTINWRDYPTVRDLPGAFKEFDIAQRS